MPQILSPKPLVVQEDSKAASNNPPSKQDLEKIQAELDKLKPELMKHAFETRNTKLCGLLLKEYGSENLSLPKEITLKTLEDNPCTRMILLFALAFPVNDKLIGSFGLPLIATADGFYYDEAKRFAKTFNLPSNLTFLPHRIERVLNACAKWQFDEKEKALLTTLKEYVVNASGNLLDNLNKFKEVHGEQIGGLFNCVLFWIEAEILKHTKWKNIKPTVQPQLPSAAEDHKTAAVITQTRPKGP